jgi:DNA polymerase-3 subunit gamma/tau
MKNMTPHITTLPAVEVVVGNELVKEELERIHGSIVNTLKLHLMNNAITLTVTVAQMEKVRVLTRSEQYEELSRQNPAVEKLRELLDLEIA